MNDYQVKPKRDYSHLKKYHFSKENPPPRSRLGSGNKRTKLTRDILIGLLEDCLTIDPETGKKRSTKWLKVQLARAAHRSDKVLVRILEQIIGKVPEEVRSQVTVVFKGLRDPGTQDDSSIIDGQIVVHELPTPDDNEQDNDK